ncbi:MAG: class I SAM-dependent methyltransferase [Planctomycetota bacterium]
MKTRESGMPAEELWATFFTPAEVLAKLGLTRDCRAAVDFGCGYGTFAIPAAQIVTGTVFTFDIDSAMVTATEAKARAAGLSNVRAEQQDFIANGTGLPDTSVDYVMLFNILHAEEPLVLLQEAHRILVPGGTLGIIHWNYDPTTPRGPSMSIRPRPEQCREWAEAAGFQAAQERPIDLPPYHYGLRMTRA